VQWPSFEDEIKVYRIHWVVIVNICESVIVIRDARVCTSQKPNRAWSKEFFIQCSIRRFCCRLCKAECKLDHVTWMGPWRKWNWTVLLFKIQINENDVFCLIREKIVIESFTWSKGKFLTSISHRVLSAGSE
jgi:hypothetical protein